MIAESSVTAAPVRHRRTFPGTATALRQVRRFVATSLADHPAVDDIVLTADEFAGNAVQYSLASRRGSQGGFTVVLTITPGIGVSLWVDDPGPAPAATTAQQRPAGEHGRGRDIIAALALASGDETTPDGHRAWADFGWSALRPAPATTTVRP